MRLLPLLALVLAAPALAQPVFGLKGGASVAWIGNDGGVGGPPLVGLVLGGAVETPLAGSLSLRAEVLYVEKGEGDIDGEPPLRPLKLAFVEVPVAVVWGVPVGGAEARVAAGAFVARRVTSDVGQSGAPDTFDGGLLAGLGVGLGAVALDARFEAGLLDADGYVPESRSRAVTLTLGYRL